MSVILKVLAITCAIFCAIPGLVEENFVLFLISIAVSIALWIVSNSYFRQNNKSNGKKTAENNVGMLDVEECYDEEDIEIEVKRLCSKLKKNMSVDMTFWNDMNLDFKCNLVTCFDALELNYEIKNDGGIPIDKNCYGIYLKVNFYDKGENLLYVDDVYIDYQELSRKRFSDSFLIDYDQVSMSASFHIYACPDE